MATIPRLELKKYVRRPRAGGFVGAVHRLEQCLDRFDKHVGCVVFRKIYWKFTLRKLYREILQHLQHFPGISRK
nr:MAG TPA: hypothetical protein [Caudoviricetes sp.]